MLHKPTPREIIGDPMLLHTHFLAFCEARAGQMFDYNDIHNCAFAQFLRELFPYAFVSVGGTYFNVRIGDDWSPDGQRIPEHIIQALLRSGDSFSHLAEILAGEPS